MGAPLATFAPGATVMPVKAIVVWDRSFGAAGRVSVLAFACAPQVAVVDVPSVIPVSGVVAPVVAVTVGAVSVPSQMAFAPAGSEASSSDSTSPVAQPSPAAVAPSESVIVTVPRAPAPCPATTLTGGPTLRPPPPTD